MRHSHLGCPHEMCLLNMFGLFIQIFLILPYYCKDYVRSLKTGFSRGWGTYGSGNAAGFHWGVLPSEGTLGASSASILWEVLQLRQAGRMALAKALEGPGEHWSVASADRQAFVISATLPEPQRPASKSSCHLGSRQRFKKPCFPDLEVRSRADSKVPLLYSSHGH